MRSRYTGGSVSPAYTLLLRCANVHSRQVIHDRLSVSNASVELDVLMRKKPRYNWPMTIFIGGMCSSAICTVSFGGSFVDALVSFPLGALLVAIQLLSVRNVLYSNVFECVFIFLPLGVLLMIMAG